MAHLVDKELFLKSVEERSTMPDRSSYMVVFEIYIVTGNLPSLDAVEDIFDTYHARGDYNKVFVDASLLRWKLLAWPLLSPAFPPTGPVAAVVLTFVERIVACHSCNPSDLPATLAAQAASLTPLGVPVPSLELISKLLDFTAGVFKIVNAYRPLPSDPLFLDAVWKLESPCMADMQALYERFQSLCNTRCPADVLRIVEGVSRKLIRHAIVAWLLPIKGGDNDGPAWAFAAYYDYVVMWKESDWSKKGVEAVLNLWAKKLRELSDTTTPLTACREAYLRELAEQIRLSLLFLWQQTDSRCRQCGVLDAEHKVPAIPKHAFCDEICGAFWLIQSGKKKVHNKHSPSEIRLLHAATAGFAAEFAEISWPTALGNVLVENIGQQWEDFFGRGWESNTGLLAEYRAFSVGAKAAFVRIYTIDKMPMEEDFARNVQRGVLIAGRKILGFDWNPPTKTYALATAHFKTFFRMFRWVLIQLSSECNCCRRRAAQKLCTCGLVQYCNKECQRVCWPAHRRHHRILMRVAKVNIDHLSPPEQKRQMKLYQAVFLNQH